jgi:LppX_LprAFG lipoprotein
MVRRPYARNATAIALSSALALTMAACNSDDKGTKPAAQSSAPAAPATPAASASTPAKTGDQILEEARAALRSVHSMKVSGGMVNDGETILVDVITDGTNAEGKITAPIKGKQVEIQAIQIGDKMYIKSPDIWKVMAPSLASSLGDRWVVGDASLKKNFAGFFSPSGWADQALKPDGKVTLEGKSQINGRPTYVLNDGSGGKLHIAADGTPLPLLLTGGDNKAAGDMSFTYDVPVNVKPPENPMTLPGQGS